MNERKFVAAFFLLVVVSCGTPHGQAPAPAADGARQFAEFGDFQLRSGERIHDFRLGYRTLGKLNADKSNAVLWPTWLGGKTENLLQFIGPEKVVDPGRYFVILVDAIGNGVSVSPSNSKGQPLMKFPKFGILDMVESEHRLVTEVFHLSRLRAVMGISMGGMQTFEWIVAYPDFMDLAIPMVGSPQSTSYDKLLWTAEIAAIELDPAWNHGNPTGPLTRGFALKDEIDSMNSTSPGYRVAHTSAKDFDAFLAETNGYAKDDGGTAWDQIRQREAIIAFDIPAGLGMTLGQTAKRVHAKLLVIVSPEDHMVNPNPALEFAGAAGAPIVKLDSSCGHLSLGCISVGPTVARFLAEPTSVHSETLRDPADY
jgi:homoserine O-acetyltransferase/O-succinyltransferase